jgi:hypothetical protein
LLGMESTYRSAKRSSSKLSCSAMLKDFIVEVQCDRSRRLEGNGLLWCC